MALGNVVAAVEVHDQHDLRRLYDPTAGDAR